MHRSICAEGPVNDLLARAADLYAGNGAALAQVAAIESRLKQPPRIAIAGAIKSGKSTLLNALVGEAIAPTDATECTRLVTWYRHGHSPRVHAVDHTDHRHDVPVVRVDGGLTFDLSHQVDDLDRIEVDWPSSHLRSATFIDTPGTGSLSTTVSARTLALLTPDGGQRSVDAIVYLLRSLNESDVEFLREITRVSSGAKSIGVVGVLSRVDESGSRGKELGWTAAQAAQADADELRKLRLCDVVVPIAGLLAFAGKTVQQNEFEVIKRLADQPVRDAQRSLVSVDRFIGSEDQPDHDARSRLLDRMGIFGIRIALTYVCDHPSSTASDLAEHLHQVSGMAELEDAIQVQFAYRANELKAISAINSLREVLEVHPESGVEDLRARLEAIAADDHVDRELELLAQMRRRPLRLSNEDAAELSNLVGGRGIRDADRLGSGDDFPKRATAAAQRWRRIADDPRLDPFTEQACFVAVRSAEAIAHRAAGSAPPVAVIEDEPTMAGVRVVYLDDGTPIDVGVDVLIGRDPAVGGKDGDADLKLVQVEDPSGQMSRSHAEIRTLDGALQVVDRGSTNGVFVRASGATAWTRLTPHKPRVWAPSETLRIGRRTLRQTP